MLVLWKKWKKNMENWGFKKLYIKNKSWKLKAEADAKHSSKPWYCDYFTG